MTQPTQSQSNLIYVTGRVSFPWIVDPQVKQNEKGETQTSYNCDLILPPNDPAFQKFMQVYAAMAQDKWKENAQAAMQRIQQDRKTRCYGAGEEKASQKTFQVHPGYAGNVYITTRSPRQPQIIRADGTVVDPSNTMELRTVASKIYGGCYCNAVIKPWIQQNASGIGVRCDLIAIQFAADGESFGAGAADVTGLFGAVAGGAPAAGAPSFAPVGQAMPAAPFPAAGVAPSFAPAAPPLGIPSFM